MTLTKSLSYLRGSELVVLGIVTSAYSLSYLRGSELLELLETCS